MIKEIFKMAELSPDFAQEMENATPGELRGFMEGDGTKTYTFLSNGTLTVQTVSNNVRMKSSCEKLLNPSKVTEIYEKLNKLERYRSNRNPKRDEGSFLFEVVVGVRTIYVKVLKNDLPKFPEVNSFTASSAKLLGRTIKAGLGLDD